MSIRIRREVCTRNLPVGLWQNGYGSHREARDMAVTNNSTAEDERKMVDLRSAVTRLNIEKR